MNCVNKLYNLINLFKKKLFIIINNSIIINILASHNFKQRANY